MTFITSTSFITSSKMNTLLQKNDFCSRSASSNLAPLNNNASAAFGGSVQPTIKNTEMSVMPMYNAKWKDGMIDAYKEQISQLSQAMYQLQVSIGVAEVSNAFPGGKWCQKLAIIRTKHQTRSTEKLNFLSSLTVIPLKDYFGYKDARWAPEYSPPRFDWVTWSPLDLLLDYTNAPTSST